MLCVNAPVENDPLSVVVETSPVRPEFLPNATPRVVAFSPPVAVMLPATLAEPTPAVAPAVVVTVGAVAEEGV